MAETVCTKTVLFAMGVGKSSTFLPVSLEMVSGKVSCKEDVRYDFTLGRECMSNELSSTFGEVNRQRLEVAINLRQCKMLSPRYILYPPKRAMRTGLPGDWNAFKKVRNKLRLFSSYRTCTKGWFRVLAIQNMLEKC